MDALVGTETAGGPFPKYFESCRSLYENFDLKRCPSHVAIIMDGNGRWAKSKGWRRVLGHEHGRHSVRESVKTAAELSVKILSLFAFSAENWARPKEEVELLFVLFARTLKEETEELAKNNVRLRITGDLRPLPSQLQGEIAAALKALGGNTGLTLNLAVNYGGKQDILQALNRVMARSGKLEAGSVSMEEFEKFLYTEELPPVDLLIRTSGEKRISNFFLWQAAYAELVFLDVLWPDFRREHFLRAILEYQNRDRRFGSV